MEKWDRHDVTELRREVLRGSAMATVITNEQVGGDEEDMCEDYSGPTYIYDYVC